MLVYHDMSDDQFEQVAVALGQRLFGPGLIGFAKGKDGGRDAKFRGTAQAYPSTASPWNGGTIIQAKHTTGINASFSDKAFFNPETETGILADELARIKALIASGELDNYLVISNRKLTGITQGKLETYLHKETGLKKDQLGFLGTSQLDDLFKLYPDALKSLDFRPLERPLIVRSDELAETIEAFGDALGDLEVPETKDLPEPRTPLDKKNRLNNMSDEYAKKLRSLYLPVTRQIDVFLGDPKNDQFLEKYHDATEEFSLKIIEFQGAEDTFDSVFNYLLDMLIDRSSVLRGNKRLTRAMLFYMYWTCDIGKNADA
ncbi:hypothetical protein KQ247_14950 [Ruegeria pomeroyi]|uniref:ABC-three component systems C-terminal domain-containing protein n=2 Tax=Ruegeria pomeroyi TaxID=89184 RepID=Q5LU24_RUEPO|nr:ABC-three component system protein [Ruegeria pomeroyi]AAV97133.1 hypothetical protein SPO1234 [Ruegeria pomeroyi DSS-3]NVL01461.1 hypothetical protein [Ruegeria pomeroyi]QWV08112.1 hypothetical protein KQ247_14950 [Ruegeria pomeroyi]